MTTVRAPRGNATIPRDAFWKASAAGTRYAQAVLADPRAQSSDLRLCAAVLVEGALYSKVSFLKSRRLMALLAGVSESTIKRRAPLHADHGLGYAPADRGGLTAYRLADAVPRELPIKRPDSDTRPSAAGRSDGDRDPYVASCRAARSYLGNVLADPKATDTDLRVAIAVVAVTALQSRLWERLSRAEIQAVAHRSERATRRLAAHTRLFGLGYTPATGRGNRCQVTLPGVEDLIRDTDPRLLARLDNQRQKATARLNQTSVETATPGMPPGPRRPSVETATSMDANRDRLGWPANELVDERILPLPPWATMAPSTSSGAVGAHIRPTDPVVDFGNALAAAANARTALHGGSQLSTPLSRKDLRLHSEVLQVLSRYLACGGTIDIAKRLLFDDYEARGMPYVPQGSGWALFHHRVTATLTDRQQISIQLQRQTAADTAHQEQQTRRHADEAFIRRMQGFHEFVDSACHDDLVPLIRAAVDASADRWLEPYIGSWHEGAGKWKDLDVYAQICVRAVLVQEDREHLLVEAQRTRERQEKSLVTPVSRPPRAPCPPVTAAR